MRAVRLRNFILAAALSTGMTSPTLTASYLSRGEVKQRYKREMTEIDKLFAHSPGLHAFVKAAYNIRYAHDKKITDPDYFDYHIGKNIDDGAWSKLVARIEPAPQLTAEAREVLEIGIDYIFTWSEPAATALVHQQRTDLLPPEVFTENEGALFYSLYGKPPVGITEEQMAAARKFTRYRIEQNGARNIEIDYGTLAKQVPARYVVMLYNELLGRDFTKEKGGTTCTDYTGPMAALIAAHPAIIAEARGAGKIPDQDPPVCQHPMLMGGNDLAVWRLTA